jgi:hypothetical protein
MRRLSGLSFALLLAACGDSGGTDGPPPVPDQVVHCAWSDGTCSQASKPTFSEAERTTGAADCGTLSGTWGDGPCDTAAVVGGYCFYVDFEAETGIAIAGLTMRDYYATASWDGTSAPADCTTAGGSWTTGAGAGTITESENNGTTGTADPLPLGGTAEGTVAAAFSDYDYYVFAVPEGGQDVRFRTFDASGASCNGIDPRVEIRDAMGALVVSFDDLGDSTCEDWWVSLPAGTYYVVVMGWQAGDYVLTTSTKRMTAARAMTASCLHAPEAACIQYEAEMSGADTANLSRDCQAEGGVYAAGGCSTANLLGHCEGITASSFPDFTTSAWFYAPVWSASSASTLCTGTLGGTWVP